MGKYSLKEVLNKESSHYNKSIDIIINTYKLALELIQKNPDLLNYKNKKQSKKQEENFLTINKAETRLIRDSLHDRTFPLETVELKIHEINHDEKINNPIIHTGTYADELSRSLHAMAFAIANHIYFRNGAYKPETEEGRSLLAHELKHVSQNNEKILADNRTKNELEEEAIKEEKKEKYDPTIYKTVTINNKSYKLTYKQYKRFKELTNSKLEEWVQQQETAMSEEDYLKLLINYKKYLETCNE